MKTFIPFTIAAALAASGFSQAQTAFSKPSGYVTKNLEVGFNLVSATLQKPAIFTGNISAVNGSILTFSADHSLPAGKMLILEVTQGSGASQSVVQEFNTYGTSSITLPAPIPGLQSGDSVSVRDTVTLEEIFGNVLQSGSNSASSDIVWLPTGPGQFDRYYLRTPFVGTPAWRKLVPGGNPAEVDAPNTPVLYIEGMFVEVKSAGKPLTMTGQVKTSPSNFAIQTGFNLVGTVYPVGSTLSSSGLESVLASASNSASSDIVWVPTSPGNFDRFYYRTPFVGTPSWRKLNPTEASVDGSNVPLTESIFIERKGAAKPITLTPPTNYSSL